MISRPKFFIYDGIQAEAFRIHFWFGGGRNTFEGSAIEDVEVVARHSIVVNEKRKANFTSAVQKSC